MIATDDPSEALDPAYVADVLSKPPFVQISGVCNVRDLGSYSTTTPNLITKPGYAFRGAEVSHITEQGSSSHLPYYAEAPPDAMFTRRSADEGTRNYYSI